MHIDSEFRSFFFDGITCFTSDALRQSDDQYKEMLENKWKELKTEFSQKHEIIEIKNYNFNSQEDEVPDVSADNHFFVLDAVINQINKWRYFAKPNDEDVALALFILDSLSNSGSPFSLLVLGYIYYFGYGVKKSKCYKQHIKQASSIALESTYTWHYNMSIDLRVFNEDISNSECLLEWLHYKVADLDDAIFFTFVLQLIDNTEYFDIKRLILNICENRKIEKNFRLNAHLWEIVFDNLIRLILSEDCDNKPYFQYCLGKAYTPSYISDIPTIDQYYAEYWLNLSAESGNELAKRELTELQNKKEKKKKLRELLRNNK